MKKVIVTGGMGYIGSHTVVELANKGYYPVIIDNLSNSNISVLEGLNKITNQAITFENFDLLDIEKTLECLTRHKDAIGVIHFAAFKAVGESVQMSNRYYQNNIMSLINILDSMKLNNIPNIIFSSSCTIYGQPDILPVTEETPLKKAESPYGFSKQIGERIIDDFVKVNNTIKGISLRYFNPIGAHSSSLIGELPNGVPNNLLPYITQTVYGKREKLYVFGSDYNTHDGTAIRDYIHVVDLAKAHVSAIERLELKANETAHEFFNIGTGHGYSVLQIINAFEKATGKKINYEIVDRRPGDVEAIYANTDRANNDLGWKAELSIEDMTRSAWRWEEEINKVK